MNILTANPERLIDLGLEIGLVPDAKFHYTFTEFAKWQIESLVHIGLQPDHKLLDVGCGPLRLGVQAINWLNTGNYYGIDGFEPYLRFGKILVNEFGLTKDFHLLLSTEFEFEKFGEKFDFAMAQSVLTHLSKEQILVCMKNMKNVMKKGGKFLFTNISTNYPRGFIYLQRSPMISGTHCTNEFYKKIADELEIEFVENVIAHPTQKAHLFKF